MLNAASAGTIAFKRDSKFTGCVVSSGDTTLGSVALVCGIGLYRSLEVASTSGCWCVSSTCLGSVLLVLLVLLLFLPLVVLVSYHYLLRFEILGCVLLAPRCLLWSLCVLVFLCCLLAVSCFCSLWLSRSVQLGPRCLLLSLWLCSSSQSLLVYLSLVSLLVYLLWPFFMLDGPGLSRRRSRSILLLSLSCLLFFSATSWRRSQPILVTNILSV